MKITQFSDYSLRLLVLLARNRDRVVTVREVAQFYGISAEHLKKVVRSLAELGHVRTVRGKHGGVVLAREPNEINLGQLIRAEENLNLLPCFNPGGDCPMPECRVRAIVDEALGAFLNSFDTRTLADIV